MSRCFKIVSFVTTCWKCVESQDGSRLFGLFHSLFNFFLNYLVLQVYTCSMIWCLRCKHAQWFGSSNVYMLNDLVLQMYICLRCKHAEWFGSSVVYMLNDLVLQMYICSMIWFFRCIHAQFNFFLDRSPKKMTLYAIFF